MSNETVRPLDVIAEIFLNTIYCASIFAFMEGLVLFYSKQSFWIFPDALLLYFCFALLIASAISIFYKKIVKVRHILPEITFLSLYLIFLVIFLYLFFRGGLIHYQINPTSFKGVLLCMVIIASTACILYLLLILEKRSMRYLKYYLGFILFMVVLSLFHNFEGLDAEPTKSIRAEKSTQSSLDEQHGTHKKTNVIFILIDALRADHLGFYGYDRSTSPNLDAFVKEGVLFQNMISQAPETASAIASLFSSTYPTSHGVFSPGGNNLSEEAVTLAEVLQGNGYVTTAFSANPVLGIKDGYDQGFDEFFSCCKTMDYFDYFFLFKAAKKLIVLPVFFPWHYYTPSKKINKKAKAFLKNGDTGFFLYVHYMDPHAPYFSHPYSGFAFSHDSISLSEKLYPLQNIVNLYDDEIKESDKYIGNLFQELRERNLYDNSLIIVTADHGEELKDHGRFGHGMSLYDELIKIPLIIKYPHSSIKGIEEKLAGTVDVAPTILDVLGITIPEGWSGHSLQGNSRENENPFIFSEDHYEVDNPIETKGDAYSLRTLDSKLIISTKSDLPESVLFDIKNDRREQHPIDDEALETELNDTILMFRDQLGARLQSDSKELDEETIKRLKSLGYMQ